MNKGALYTERPEAKREKLIVLVIDGDPVSQFYTCIFLQRFNYHVISVRTAEEALVIMELTTPLIIITEITLQQMSGVDLLKHVKQDPRTRNVPVLIYTAVKAEAQRDLCRAAGCAGYLVHTSDHNILFEAVQQATGAETASFYTAQDAARRDRESPGNAGPGGVGLGDLEKTSYVRQLSATAPERDNGRVHAASAGGGANGLRLTGMVIYSHAAPRPGKDPGMGVKFLRLQPDDNAMIRALIEKKMMNGIITNQKT